MGQRECLILVLISVLIVGCDGAKNAGAGDAVRENFGEAAKSPVPSPVRVRSRNATSAVAATAVIPDRFGRGSGLLKRFPDRPVISSRHVQGYYSARRIRAVVSATELPSLLVP
jgi:hypothetical protein